VTRAFATTPTDELLQAFGDAADSTDHATGEALWQAPLSFTGMDIAALRAVVVAARENPKLSPSARMWATQFWLALMNQLGIDEEA
jgi:hypothetical protein